MKKLLLILITFLSINSFAQDKAYIEKIRNLKSQDEAIKVGWDIVSLMREKFVLNKKTDEDENGLTLIFLKANTVDSLRKINPQKMEFPPEDVIKIYFTKEVEGGNIYLETKGTLYYNFYGVSYKYLDLFPFWQKYFRSDASIETTVNEAKNFELREYRCKEIDDFCGYRFESNKDYWNLKRIH
ncbi:hypothetical protein ACTS9V_06685 [Empedobacter falsenii]